MTDFQRIVHLDKIAVEDWILFYQVHCKIDLRTVNYAKPCRSKHSKAFKNIRCLYHENISTHRWHQNKIAKIWYVVFVYIYIFEQNFKKVVRLIFVLILALFASKLVNYSNYSEPLKNAWKSIFPSASSLTCNPV